MGTCHHIAGVICENCRQAYAMLYPYMQPSCQHCYCQAGPQIGGVPHMECCKCGERCAAHQMSLTWRPAPPPGIPFAGSATTPDAGCGDMLGHFRGTFTADRSSSEGIGA